MKTDTLKQLVEKGVVIPNPETIYISEDVNPDRISGQGVTLYSGTKLVGARTLILENSTIGYEAPAVIENSLVGPDTHLKGGYFQEAVFLGGNEFGSGGHVRKGTILEEEANAAHTVGLKQTILFPFVTLGSLINFCDCFMSGGTSRKDHSEVGSSFIHFNYTPNQDKATPSMMGNVHQGVMLNQPPIFLGGQGGLVGPLRIGFGNITAAGSVVRKTEEKSNRLILGGALKDLSIPRKPGVYTQVKTIFNHNIAYIAGLISLRSWYTRVRPLFIQDPLHGELIKGLQENLDLCVQERISRLWAFKEKLKISRQIIVSKSGTGAASSHDQVLGHLDKAEGLFKTALEEEQPTKGAEEFIRSVEKAINRQGKSYIKVIQSLDEASRRAGSEWLFSIEKTMTRPLFL